MNALTLERQSGFQNGPSGRFRPRVTDRHRIGPQKGRATSSSTLECEILPSWIEVVRDRLEDLRKLPHGWDGYSSPSIREESIAYGINILASVMRLNTPAPFIAPVTGGGLQFEWHRNGLDVELLIAGPLKADLYVEYSDGREPTEMDFSSNFAHLGEILDSISK